MLNTTTVDRVRTVSSALLASTLLTVSNWTLGQPTQYTIDGATAGQPLTWVSAGVQSQVKPIAGTLFTISFVIICAVIGKAYMNMGEGRAGNGWSNFGGISLVGLLIAALTSYLGYEIWNLNFESSGT